MQELKKQAEDLRERFLAFAAMQDRGAKQQKLGELESVSLQPEFWDDNARAQSIMQEISTLKEEIDLYADIDAKLNEVEEFIALGDAAYAGEIESQLADLEAEFHKLEFTRLFEGKYDQNDAILSIHAGTGGVDAQDWAEMLSRMYLRLGDKMDWKMTLLERTVAEEAGIKSAEIEVKGARAYGYLKAEHGVHRLVRISPFNAKKSRETSFALVEVLPLVPGNDEVQIDENDLRIDVFRAGGHGGQGVNTTDSAVRITHLPTGIVVTCQNERSQLQNKQNAMRVLKARLQKKHEEEFDAALEKTKGEYKQGTWGNQIRSYVLQPYTMVKDHRTDHEVSDVDAVLDGALEDFMIAYLKHRLAGKA
jgi:peptide chain release factor 2